MIERNYLCVPKKLILEVQDNLLALALYLLIARLYLVVQRPVPFSRGDAARFDRSVKVGAFLRAIERLEVGGWLIVDRSGYKHAYTPTWGVSRTGRLYPWEVGPELLGRPKHIATVRIDRDILDLFFGRFIPGKLHSGIERYVTAPLLRLLDVGAYIAATDGYELREEHTRALRRWGLLRDGQALPVSDERVILALVSQRGGVDGPRLTEAGWRKLGWPMPAADVEEIDPSSVLIFFDEKARISRRSAQAIPTKIGQADSEEAASSAPEHHETPLPTTRRNGRGNSKEYQESQDLPNHSKPTSTEPAGGGCLPSTRHKSIPDTAAAQLLWEIGCYPSSIAELCGMPVEQVGGAVAYARSQPNIESVPAWVVDALRRMRDEGWTLPSEGTPGASQVERWSTERTAQIAGGWGDLFRLGSDTSDLDDTNVRCQVSGRAGRSPDLTQPRGHAANEIGTERDARATPDAPDAQPGQARATPGATPAPNRAMCSNGTETLTGADRSNGAMYNAKPGAAPAAGPPAAPGDAEGARAYVLSRQAREELRRRCDRGYSNTIAGIQLQPARDRTVVTCANRADRSIMADILIGPLRQVVKELGLPTELEIVVQGAPPVAVHRWATEPQGGLQ